MTDAEQNSDAVTVAVHGATGYTARELLAILARHPHARVTAVTTRRDDRPRLDEVHPSLRGRFGLRCEDLTAKELAGRAEYVFCCTPHGASMAVVPDLLDAGATVIDLSADYRLSDPDVYRRWYGLEHTDAARLPGTVYGLPELFADRIPGRRLVANPGCYTGTSILALAPLLAAGLVEPTGLVIDAKSGASGAGRSPKLGTLFCEVNESLRAYGVGTHRHQPEIEQVLSDFTGRAVDVIFTPHLVPMDRGILATIYADPVGDPSEEKLIAAVRAFYADQPFVRVTDSLPATADVAYTNYCDLTARRVKGKVLVLAVLDNLLKGAAGVAVQNFNLLGGWGEEAGLV